MTSRVGGNQLPRDNSGCPVMAMDDIDWFNPTYYASQSNSEFFQVSTEICWRNICERSTWQPVNIAQRPHAFVCGF